MPRTVFIILSPCKMLQGFLGLVEMFWFVANFDRNLTDQNPHMRDVFSSLSFFLYIVIILNKFHDILSLISE